MQVMTTQRVTAENYHLTLKLFLGIEHCSVFKLIILDFRPWTLMFWLTLSAFMLPVQTK